MREVFFELPDAGRIVAEGAFRDVYYEHANYFGPRAFEAAFRHAGMTVTESSRLFHGQDLGLCARSEPVAEPPGESPPDAVESWASLEQQRSLWQGLIGESRAPIVIWGSGSKGVAFLTGADPERRIEAAVDINPHRQDRFMPGTGQPIIAPEALVELQPAMVIIMNPGYEAEIGQRLAALGLDPRIEVVGAGR